MARRWNASPLDTVRDLRTLVGMRPQKLTIEAIEAEWGPADTWHGHCYSIAAAAHRLLGQGKLAYGHYLGDISPDGFWQDRRGLPFVQHGWVKLRGGRVLDPTRWSFLNERPSIWIGTSDEYDEGGQQWRAICRSPAPDDDASSNQISMEGLSPLAAHHFDAMLGRRTTGQLNYFQAIWLASGPVNHLGHYARELFELLVKHGWGAAIPIDTRRLVLD